MLPSPAKRAWTMNPRPEWVVTVRLMGTAIDLLASFKRQVGQCARSRSRRR